MTGNRTIRHCAGMYERTDGVRSVSVRFYEHVSGWIASAQWDGHLHTDPLPTKRDAVHNADHMIGSAK